MVFALEYYNKMKKKYPHVLDGEWKNDLDMAMQGVELADIDIMHILQLWKKDKMLYNFADRTAFEILNQTAPLEYIISSDFLRLPYPCIAVDLIPIELFNGDGMNTVGTYTGRAFIWMEGTRLFSSWETSEATFETFDFDLSTLSVMDDAYDIMVKEELAREKYNDAELILKLLRVERFADINYFDQKQINRLSYKFGDEGAVIIQSVVRRVSAHEALLHRVINTVLYLNCTNADIEAAEEKLKAGAWASILGGTPDKPIPKTKRQQIQRQNQEANVQDVGYRIAGKFKRSYSEDTEETESRGINIGNRGYGKRRAHYHHFWIGPRNGPIAEDIMHPQQGERGLVMYWLEATEIHPELRNDLATEVGVE